MRSVNHSCHLLYYTQSSRHRINVLHMYFLAAQLEFFQCPCHTVDERWALTSHDRRNTASIVYSYYDSYVMESQSLPAETNMSSLDANCVDSPSQSAFFATHAVIRNQRFHPFHQFAALMSELDPRSTRVIFRTQSYCVLFTKI